MVEAGACMWFLTFAGLPAWSRVQSSLGCYVSPIHPSEGQGKCSELNSDGIQAKCQKEHVRTSETGAE